MVFVGEGGRICARPSPIIWVRRQICGEGPLSKLPPSPNGLPTGCFLGKQNYNSTFSGGAIQITVESLRKLQFHQRLAGAAVYADGEGFLQADVTQERGLVSGRQCVQSAEVCDIAFP